MFLAVLFSSLSFLRSLVIPLFPVVSVSAHCDFYFANLVPFRVLAKYHTKVLSLRKSFRQPSHFTDKMGIPKRFPHDSLALTLIKGTLELAKKNLYPTG